MFIDEADWLLGMNYGRSVVFDDDDKNNLNFNPLKEKKREEKKNIHRRVGWMSRAGRNEKELTCAAAASSSLCARVRLCARGQTEGRTDE